MSLHRFFLRGPLASGEAVLSAADLRHLRDVLRLRPGDEVVLAGEDGRAAVARLTTVGDRAVSVEVVRELGGVPEPRVTLVQGLARRERMEFAIQKAVEVGVAAVMPVVTARSVVKLDEARAASRAERWRRIAEEAAKQSQRAFVPPVHEPVPLREAVALLAAYDVVLVPWEEASGRGIGEALDEAGATGASSVGVVVGPEGGLEAAEVSALEAAGAYAVSLGPSILRTETAALVATALAMYELGGLGGRAR